MVKSSFLKAYLKNWTGDNLQKEGKTRRKRAKANQAAQKKLRGYRKEEAALMQRKKQVNKILSNKSNLMPGYKSKPLKLNKL